MSLVVAGLVSFGFGAQSPRITQNDGRTVIQNDLVRVFEDDVPEKPLLAADVVNPDFPVEIVRVLRVNPAPGAKSGAYEAWRLANLRYAEKDEMFGVGDPYGGCREFWIELREAPAPSSFADDAVKLDSKHNEVLLDNDRVRVVRIHFGPGESGPMVDKRARVIIMLADSHATVTLPDGHSEVRDGKAGTVSFSKAGRQATNNVGTTPLENIVVELKSK